jgi:hypothetical protein
MRQFSPQGAIPAIRSAGFFCCGGAAIAIAPRMTVNRLAYRFGLYPGMQIQPVNDSDAMYPSRQTGSVKTTAKRMIRPPITARKANRDCGFTVRNHAAFSARKIVASPTSYSRASSAIVSPDA